MTQQLTPNLQLPYYQGSDPADGATQQQALAQKLDTVLPPQFEASPPIGSLMMWLTATAPANWLLCHGQQVAQATYPKLAAALGRTGTFNLPNMQSRMPVGAGAAPGLTTRAVTDTPGGEEVHTLRTAEAAQKAVNAVAVDINHTHGATDGGLATIGVWGEYTHYMSDTYYLYGGAGGYGMADSGYPINTTHAHNTGWMDRSNAHGHPINGEDAAAPHNNMPPFVVVEFIIRAA